MKTSEQGLAGPSPVEFGSDGQSSSELGKLDRAEPSSAFLTTRKPSNKITKEGALIENLGMPKVPHVAHCAASNLGESLRPDCSGSTENLNSFTE